MTYLATEMLLYLLCAAVFGFALGWLVWGMGRRQQMSRQHAELMAMIDAEQAANKQAQINLDRAEARLQQAVQAEKSAAAETLAAAQENLEAERRTAQEARANLEKMRLDMEQTVGAERASASEAIDEAMRLADNHKVVASDAKTKETQFLAEIEELRLLVGAEKLAAQSARAELARVRADMETTLEAERRANAQSRLALDDIRTTLSRTFGADAAVTAMSLTGPDENETSTRQVADGQADIAVDRQTNITFPVDGGNSMAGLANGASTNSDDALEDLATPDRDDVDIEDLEDQEPVLPSTDEPQSTIVPGTGSTIDPAPDHSGSHSDQRPALLLDQRPEEVDDLKEIDGIEPAMEQLLNDNGCYQYRQLARLSASDITWLSKELNVFASRIKDDRWVEQAEILHQAKYGPRQEDPPWFNSAANLETGS